MLCCNKIDEAVANIALIFDIARQIEKVISVLKMIVYLLGEFLNGILVGNVSDHYSCSCIVLDVFRHHQVKIALIIRFVVVVIVVTGVVTWLEEGENGVGINRACVTFRKGRVYRENVH